MRHAKTLRQMIGGECSLVPGARPARVKLAAAFARSAPLPVLYCKPVEGHQVLYQWRRSGEFFVIESNTVIKFRISRNFLVPY
jgi:hypothetical protein